MSKNRLGMFTRLLALLTSTFLLVLVSFVAEATHLRAGEITVERINCASRTFRVTVTVYTDTESGILFGGSQDILDFGDGERILVPETGNTPYPGGGAIGFASRSFIHTFPGPGKYTISYIEPNRNAGVLNMSNSVNTTFYIETQIDISVLGCSESPKLLVPPIDRACTGEAFYHNPGAYDPDGDSLSYELVIPYSNKNLPVLNYRDPSNSGFYGPGEYLNEAGDGPPTFSIDPVTGTLVWDAPGLPPNISLGEFNIAFVVKEWRKINGEWKEIGFVRRDMQIIVEDCNNERPELEIPEDVCVTAGETVNATIFGFDPNNHQVKIEAFSEIFAFDNPPTISPNPPIFQPSATAQLQFTWNTECANVKDQPYQVVFKITDNPPIGPKLVTFATWRITVVGPAPVWEPATTDPIARHVNLEWQPYECYENATRMQVWRRVESTSFSPAECETGMPESLGFSLIAEVPVKDASNNPITTYTDTNNGQGLEPGAKYCYRLVAVFPLPQGGESYVSDEICIDPFVSNAPIITNVTVDVTGDTDGEITIRWIPPLDIDPVQFPGPYEYVVQRATPTGFINVSAPLSVLSFVDQGLDTRDLNYSYQVQLYSPTPFSPTTPVLVSTSSLASAVWLELFPQTGRIDLSWNAVVPWSNQLETFPLHDIYRGPENATEAEMVFVGTVNVTQAGFRYADVGLDDNTEYCYRVMTRGGYGNSPSIAEPLENYSQIICAFPKDDDKPCTPELEAFTSSCEDFVENYGCSAANFTNVLKWARPEGACGDDIRSYNVYVAGTANGVYTLLATNVRDTFYLHQNISSLAYCYKVSAVDRSNNESDLSEPACNDNCPYYELPNVFTPGDGNNCNDIFRAFGDNLGEGAGCPTVDPFDYRCARFVQRVNFTVYNRWGQKVYDYTGQVGDQNNSIYIRWKGIDDQGKELSSGIYYYLAEVTFDTVNPKERVKQIKGWVHIIRPGDFRSSSN